MTASITPDAICVYAISILINAEAHCISTVIAGTEFGKLHISPISRPMLPPVPTALPQNSPSTCEILWQLINASITLAPSTSGLICLYCPFKTPMGLRSPQ